MISVTIDSPSTKLANVFQPSSDKTRHTCLSNCRQFTLCSPLMENWQQIIPVPATDGVLGMDPNTQLEAHGHVRQLFIKDNLLQLIKMLLSFTHILFDPFN